MARRKKETIEKTLKLKQSELKQAIADASRQKRQAAEYSGFHGRTVKNFCERTSFDRTVFGWLRKLHDMNDPLKVQAIVRQFLMGVELLDWNAQGDLFDSVQTEIANKAELDGEGAGEDEERDLRPAFLQNAMPLDQAEDKFDTAKELAEAKKAVARKAKLQKSKASALEGLANLATEAEVTH